MGILKNCAVGFSRKPYQISDLAGFFRKAGLEGFSVMRIASSSILLMFDEEGQRKEILESGVLNECGIPIHAWSETTFENVARVWGELSRVDIETLVPSSFERARFQIETDWSGHIDETLDLRVGDQSFPLRVTEIEEAIGPKCDCVCELVGDFQDASKSVSDGEEKERRHASVLEGRKGVSNSTETIVPNSIMSKTVNSIEINRMWEGNKRVDWQRDNEVCCSGMDLLEECGIQIDDQQILSKETNMGSPTGSGLKARAKLSDVIERGREQHKVRQLSGILMSEVPPEDRIVTTKGVPKRGRGRSKTKNIESDRVVNGSLSDLNFFNTKKVILKETEETVQLGKLIGAAPNGNELTIIQDIERNKMESISEKVVKHVWFSNSFRQLVVDNWKTGGDFNTVLRVEERRGCSSASRGMDEFCEFVNTVALCEIPFQVSDNSDSGLKPFRFFNAWLRNPQHVREMECVWNGFRHRDGTDSLVCKMRALKEVLKVWNRDSFGNVDDNYRELVNALEQLDTKQGGGELDDNDLSHKRDLVSKL
ncbi:hypothetical protein V6N13_122591 [Hibiscus sabdariffa]